MMKQRDFFAAAALTGLLSDTRTTTAAHGMVKDGESVSGLLSAAAYEYADAMMKARKAQGEGK